MDPYVALEWIDMVRGVLTYMGCAPKLWVHMVIEALKCMSKIWWEFAHAYLGRRPLE